MAYLVAENDPLRMWRTQAIRDVCHEAGYRRTTIRCICNKPLRYDLTIGRWRHR